MGEKQKQGKRDEVAFKERRQHPRVSGSVIEYSYIDVESYRVTAFVKDLSIGGVCIYVHEDIEMNTKLKLFIHLFGNEKPIETYGEVRWKAPSTYHKCFDIGIQFLDLDEGSKEKLTQYIREVDKDAVLEEAPPKKPPQKEVLEEEEKPVEGIFQEFYDSGEILSEVNVVKGKMEGLKKYYYRSGELLEEITFQGGERNGVRKSYYKNGKIHLEQFFANGRSVAIKKFNQNGDLIFEKQE